MPVDELTREDFWHLANDGLAIAGIVGVLLAVLLGMAFVRAVWS